MAAAASPATACLGTLRRPLFQWSSDTLRGASSAPGSLALAWPSTCMVQLHQRRQASLLPHQAFWLQGAPRAFGRRRGGGCTGRNATCGAEAGAAASAWGLKPPGLDGRELSARQRQRVPLGRSQVAQGMFSDIFPLSEPQQQQEQEELQEEEEEQGAAGQPPPPASPNGAHSSAALVSGKANGRAAAIGFAPGGDFVTSTDLGDDTLLFSFGPVPQAHGNGAANDGAAVADAGTAAPLAHTEDASEASAAPALRIQGATSAPQGRQGPDPPWEDLSHGAVWLAQEDTLGGGATAAGMPLAGDSGDGRDADLAGPASSAEVPMDYEQEVADSEEPVSDLSTDPPGIGDVESVPASSFPLVDGLFASAVAGAGDTAAQAKAQEAGTNGAFVAQGSPDGAGVAQGEAGGDGGAGDDDVCVPSFEDGIVVKCPLRLESGASMLPHPAKVARGGEDAFFIEGDWVGVADGVSGWAALGVNSGLYSRDLMWQCAEVVRWGEAGKDPRAVIEEAHSRTDFQGSCTVTVACLDDRVLRVANLGDSGFLLLRDGAVVERSQCMQHAFDSPFHIGKSAGDDPSESQVYELEVHPGDVLLLGTDGLYDNVFETQIINIVSIAIAEGRPAEVAAKRLSVAAQKNASCTTGTTPFCEEAKAAGNKYEGGKLDDITVIVSYLF